MGGALLSVMSCAAQAQKTGGAWISNNEIWMEGTAGPRQLTHDGIPKRSAALSPDGTRIVYLVDQGPADHQSLPREALVELNANGEVLRHIAPQGYVPGPFDRLEWIDNQRIGALVSGHANCMYWIVAAGSGRTLKVMEGGFDFIWSHNRNWVARRFVEIAGVPPGNEFDSLVLNETQVYPPLKAAAASRQSRPREGHQFGPFTWSPHDKWLGFTDKVSAKGDTYVVLVSPQGRVLRAAVPVDVSASAEPEWDGDSHFHVVVAGQTFKFVVLKGSLQEEGPASAVALCPDTRLREATIGGEAIAGSVRLHKKALALARVRMFSSSGQIAWTGATDKRGHFVSGKLPPDDYRLEIDGWGSTTVHLKPVDKSRPIPVWSLQLGDNGCIGTGEIMN